MTPEQIEWLKANLAVTLCRHCERWGEPVFRVQLKLQGEVISEDEIYEDKPR